MPTFAEGSTPGCLLQRNLVQGGFSGVGTGAAGWAGLSQGPRGGKAVHFRHAGRSPRSPCPAAPAVSLVAGGRPSACGGSPTIVPASRRRAWDDRSGERDGGFWLCWRPAHPKAAQAEPYPTHLFSGSRSQQRTVMGKKLGGQLGGQ